MAHVFKISKEKNEDRVLKSKNDRVSFKEGTISETLYKRKKDIEQEKYSEGLIERKTVKEREIQ